MSQDAYETDEAQGEGWKLLLGDSCERLSEIEEDSIDLSVFSPPFASLYTYSPSPRDLGNSQDRDEFFEHFAFIITDLQRVTKPGRLACVHVQQIVTTKGVHGVVGLTDFRGQVIAAFQERGWVLHGEVTIDKDPQAQAIRTKAQALMFQTLNRDSACPCRLPAGLSGAGRQRGPDQTRLRKRDLDRVARPVWYSIRESDTLNTTAAREDADERHICPLQLPLLERCVRLWSNRDELVFSPFAGIGSEGYVAIEHGRRFVGIELKRSYWKTAVDNLDAISSQTRLEVA